MMMKGMHAPHNKLGRIHSDAFVFFMMIARQNRNKDTVGYYRHCQLVQPIRAIHVTGTWAHCIDTAGRSWSVYYARRNT
jgi:hypothetical protein